MATIPSVRFSKTNWLNFHRYHCSRLITNCFNVIVTGGSIAAGLYRYRSVCKKYLEPLKTLNCGKLNISLAIFVQVNHFA